MLIRFKCRSRPLCDSGKLQAGKLPFIRDGAHLGWSGSEWARVRWA